MSEASGADGAGPQVTGLETRYAALRQAARSRGAQASDVLDAAFTELEGAIELLRAAQAGPDRSHPRPAADSQPAGSDNAERSLLRAAFQDTPVPLFLLTRDGTVQRVNKAAGDLIGAKPGYATGRPFTTFVNLPSRAAVNSQLTAVTRTGKQRRVTCSLLASGGLVSSELVIGRVAVRGEADPLMVAVRWLRRTALRPKTLRPKTLCPKTLCPKTLCPKTPRRLRRATGRPVVVPGSARCRPSPGALTWSRRSPGCCWKTRVSASPGRCSDAPA